MLLVLRRKCICVTCTLELHLPVLGPSLILLLVQSRLEVIDLGFDGVELIRLLTDFGPLTLHADPGVLD